MKYPAAILFFLLTSVTSFSQFYPIYSQYMMNGMVLNPGYTGSRGTFALSSSYRKQWVGIEGAPEITTFSAHAPLKNDKVALGLLVFNESIGIKNTTGIFANYAYHIHAGSGRLSFGLKGGVHIINADFSSIRTVEEDPVFTSGLSSYTLPNFGVGFYYYTDKAFFGASVPRLLSYRERSSRNSYEIYHDIKQYNFLITTGVMIQFSKEFMFKPSFLIKYSQVSPLQVDLNGNFIIKDFLWLGGSWRIDDNTLVGIIEIQVNDQFKIGYSYDYNTGDLNTFNNGTHEIVVRYEFGYKVNANNPRYF